MAQPSDELPPPENASSRRRASARVPRSLVQVQEPGPAEEAAPATEIPYATGMGTGRPGVSVGFEIQQGELIFPWMALQMVQRSGNQMLIMIGDWRFSLEYDETKAVTSGWKFMDMLDAIMDQSVRWIRHRPDAGLTVHGIQEEKPPG